MVTTQRSGTFFLVGGSDLIVSQLLHSSRLDLCVSKPSRPPVLRVYARCASPVGRQYRYFLAVAVRCDGISLGLYLHAS